MKEYRVKTHRDRKEIIFDQEPDKLAIIIETEEGEERIILPNEIDCRDTYYVEPEKDKIKSHEDENKVTLDSKANILEVLVQ